MIAEKQEYKGYSLEIHYDEHPDPPDWGMDVVKCYHWHRRYDIMNTRMGDLPETQAEADDEVNKLAGPGGIALPIYLYDHGGLRLKVGSFQGLLPGGHYEWDSGQVGWVYIDGDTVQKEWGGRTDCDRVEARKAARAYAEAIVNVWDDYYRGAVYGYIVRSPEGEAVDSCWGYYGDEGGFSDVYAEMESYVDYELREMEQFHNMC